MNPIIRYNQEIEINDTDFLSVPTIAIQKECFVKHFIESIENGDIDPLELRVKFKCMQDALEQVLKNESVAEKILNAFDNYGEKLVSAYGAEIKKSSRTNYDFSNDSKWSEITEQRKDREKLLKAIKPGESLFDTDTGEELTHCIKSQSTYLTVTLK